MPLLKREAEFFPEGVFQLSETASPWWIAHTRSRQEKALARYLQPLQVPFYLPQRENEIRSAGRRRVSYLPLLPGYVFFRGAASERQAALDSRLLVRVLPVFDQARLQSELCLLSDWKRSGASLELLEELHPGDAVRIQEGPFQGYSGVVIRGQARLRLVVSITVLRKTVAVELDREVLKALSASSRSHSETRTAVA